MGGRLGREGRSPEFLGNCPMLTFPFPDDLRQFRPFVFKVVCPLGTTPQPCDLTQKKSILPLRVICVSQDSSVSSGPAQQSRAKVFLASSACFPCGFRIT